MRVLTVFSVCSRPTNHNTIFPRLSAPGRLPIFEVFGGALNRARALIKTDENVDSPFPKIKRMIEKKLQFMI